MQEVRILHVCADFVAVDKPAGVLLDKSSWKSPEPPPPTVTSLTAELLVKRGEKNLALMHVHQLDKATSGCIMFARNSHAAGNASISFQMRRTKKKYRAVVWGHMPAEANVPFIVALPLAKCPFAPLFEMVGNSRKAGRSAITEISVLGRGHLTSLPETPVTLVELKLLTGRRHQLRLHLAALGYTIVGDPLFSTESLTWPRMLLHSLSLEVPLAPPYTSLSIKTDEPFRILFANFDPNTATCSPKCKLFPPPHSFDMFNRCHAVLFTVDKKTNAVKLLLRKVSKKKLHKRTFMARGNCWGFSAHAQVLTGDADVHQALAKALASTPFLSACLPSQDDIFVPGWCGLSSRLSEQYDAYIAELKVLNGKDVCVSGAVKEKEHNILNEEEKLFDIHRVAAYLRRGREDRIALIYSKPYSIFFIHIHPSVLNIALSKEKIISTGLVNGVSNSMVVKGNPTLWNHWFWTPLEKALEVAGDKSSHSSQGELLNSGEESLPLDKLLQLTLVHPGLLSWLRSHEEYDQEGFVEGRNLFDLGVDLVCNIESKNFTSKIKREDPQCIEIEIGVFVGTIKGLTKATELRSITHVVLCGPTQLVPQGLKYHVLSFANDLKTSAEPFIPSVIEFIRQAHQEDGRVLVCSDSGQAVTLVIAWLVGEKKMILSDAMRRVTERGVELPNTRCLLDLSSYEAEVLGKRTYEIPTKKLVRYYKRTLHEL